MSDELSPDSLGLVNNLDDLPIRLTVVLGTVLLKGRDLKGMVEGAALDLERNTGAPLIVLANGMPVALAEPVPADDEFGIRITRVLNENERRDYRLHAETIPYSRVD